MNARMATPFDQCVPSNLLIVSSHVGPHSYDILAVSFVSVVMEMVMAFVVAAVFVSESEREEKYERKRWLRLYWWMVSRVV